MILKDYKCSTHGFFEAGEPICPEGCTDGIHVVFLQAPALLGEKTKAADSHLDSLADQFKMSDIKSTREGESQSGYLLKNNKFSEKEYAEAEAYMQSKPQEQREARPGDSAIWGQNFQGLNMQNILSGRAVQSVRGESVGMTPSQAGINQGPRIDPRSTFRDPDNLKINK
jgi:hypothetical protein